MFGSAFLGLQHVSTQSFFLSFFFPRKIISTRQYFILIEICYPQDMLHNLRYSLNPAIFVSYLSLSDALKDRALNFKVNLKCAMFKKTCFVCYFF